MDYTLLAILAGFVFVYGAISGRLERTPLNGALLFVLFGLALGPLGFGLLDLQTDAEGRWQLTEGLQTLAELTLALVLFSDAAGANARVLERSYAIPGHLLGLGLPMTIALGFVVAWLIFDGLGWVELALLAVMLAPTDAALGKAVVSNEAVPATIREGLNVESGLNDGICVPILLVLLQINAGQQGSIDMAMSSFGQQVGVGAVVGIGCTLIGSRLVLLFLARGWTGVHGRQLLVPALALICFGTAQALGGSGFIACFLGGLYLGLHRRADPHLRRELLRVGESVGDLFSLLAWVMFGGCIVAQTLTSITWQVLLYAMLSLTVIRILPVFLALWGTDLSWTSKLFMGWFGPRGLASIVFIVIVAEQSPPGIETLTAVVMCTITLSVLAHGLTAVPLANALGRSAKSH